MDGDSTNTVVFAQRMLADGAIDPSSYPEPTALPFAVVAATASSGRGSSEDGLLLGHDVLRSLKLWIGVMAAESLLAAVIIARSLRGLRPHRVLLAVFRGRVHSVRHGAVGALAFLTGLSVGILRLLIQRVGAESEGGYYVVKFV